MGLFDANLKAVRRAFETAWRDIARRASEEGFLTAPRARLEIRMHLWVYADRKKSTATRDYVYRSTFDLDSQSPMAERLPKSRTVWDEIMEE